jgi:hypothetical protein
MKAEFTQRVRYLSGLRIRIDLMRIRIPDPDSGFDDLKLKKIYSWEI